MGTITKNFDYAEFERSATAKSLGICNVITTFAVRDAVKELTVNLLQPLRDAWGSGLTVTSGYRCEALNRAVGGSATSAHVYGWAADIVPANGKMQEFYEFTERWLKERGIAFDQCIRERNAAGTSRWLHLGWKNRLGQQRRMFLNLVKK